jgi:hypothetical protein
MSLVDIVNNDRTDKNTVHSYLPVYDALLKDKQHTATNVLEIGICQGGSIKLWYDFFTNANVYGIDIMNYNDVWNDIKRDRIQLYTSTDAYNEDFVKSVFVDTNKKFDLILDDGPHTLESMIKFVKLYSTLLSDNGILIIEDIQSYDWIESLRNIVPDDLKMYIGVYDLRDKKNRYDDILFVINKF